MTCPSRLILPAMVILMLIFIAGVGGVAVICPSCLILQAMMMGVFIAGYARHEAWCRGLQLQPHPTPAAAESEHLQHGLFAYPQAPADVAAWLCSQRVRCASDRHHLCRLCPILVDIFPRQFLGIKIYIRK